MLEMCTPAPPGAIRAPNSSRTRAGAVQVDGEDRLRAGLDRGDAGGADHSGDVAEVGGGLSERVDHLAVVHVDR
jgi:hypothetical protein